MKQLCLNLNFRPRLQQIFERALTKCLSDWTDIPHTICALQSLEQDVQAYITYYYPELSKYYIACTYTTEGRIAIYYMPPQEDTHGQRTNPYSL